MCYYSFKKLFTVQIASLEYFIEFYSIAKIRVKSKRNSAGDILFFLDLKVIAKTDAKQKDKEASWFVYQYDLNKFKL